MKTGAINLPNIAIAGTGGHQKSLRNSKFYFDPNTSDGLGSISALKPYVEGDIVAVSGPAIYIPDGAGNGLTHTDYTAMPTDAFVVEAMFDQPVPTSANFRTVYGRVVSSGGGQGWEARISDIGTPTFTLYTGSAFETITGDVAAWAGALGCRWAFSAGEVTFDKWDGSVWSAVGSDTATLSALLPVTDGYVGVGTSNLTQGEMAGVLPSSLTVKSINGLTTYLDFRSEDVPVNVDATTITPTVGPTLTVNRSTTGPMTTIVPAGRSLVINPDHTNAGNKITTGQGIAKTSVAVFPGISATDLRFVAGASDVCPANNFTVSVVLDRLVSDAVGVSGDAELYGFVTSAGGGKGWAIRLDMSSNNRTGITYHDGSVFRNDFATADPAADSIGVRAIVGGGNIEFYETADGVVWTKQGGTVSMSSTINAAVDAADTITIGSNNGATQFYRGGIRSIVVTDDSAERTTFHIDETDLARGAEGDSSFPCLSGQTITVNGNVGWSVSEWVGPEPSATFDGISGTYESVPDAPEFDITGDMCIVAKVALDDWTPGASGSILGKLIPVGNQRSYVFGVLASTGRLFFQAFDGTNITINQQSADPEFVDGSSQWVAVTVDVDDGAGNHVLTWWVGGTGAVPVWSINQVDTVIGPNPTIHAGTAPLEIGSYNLGTVTPFDGDILYVALFDGIGDGSAPGLGTKVFERNQVDLARANTIGVADSESYPSASGHTVTRNGGVTYTGLAPMVIPADDSAILGGLFVVGNQTGVFPKLVQVGSSVAGEWGVELFRDNDTDNVSARIETPASNITAAQVAFDSTDLRFYCAHIDRSADLLRNIVITSSGTKTENTVDISLVGAINVIEGITTLSSLPGALGSLVFDSGDAMLTPEQIALTMFNSDLSGYSS